MPTNTAGNAARELPFQATHTMRKRVNYNDTNIATGVPFAQYLPKGARIFNVRVFIKTAFNAGTTNVLTVGQNSSSYNDMVAAGDVDETATGMTQVNRGANLDLDSADVQVFVKYTQTGAAATTGAADVIIEYAPNNDQ